MTRPTNIDPADLAAWEAEFEAAALTPELGMLAHVGPQARALFKEVSVSGAWLHRELLAAGADAAAAQKACFAHGQRCWGEPDPWLVAALVLARYRAGDADEPGARLAAHLLAKGGAP